MSKPTLIIITGPSGFNKRKLLVNELVNNFNGDFEHILSTTDRPINLQDKDGFIHLSKEEFDTLVENRGFIEWQKLFIDGYRYGKSRDLVEDRMKNSKAKYLVTKINVINLPVFKRHYPNSKSIFIDVKDTKKLVAHLEENHSEELTGLTYEERFNFATEERRRRHLADFIINFDQDVEKTISEIIKIVQQ